MKQNKPVILCSRFTEDEALKIVKLCLKRKKTISKIIREMLIREIDRAA